MSNRPTDHLNHLRPEKRAQVKDRIEAFEQAWQRGERPAIADHLPADSDIRLAVLLELVHIDLERRIKAGEAARLQSYLNEFPELAKDSRWVAQLAAAEQERRTGLAATATILAPDLPQSGPMSGERIRYFGDYELLEQIARGGMGVVYKARQLSLHRVVALKMILAGQLASESDVERFYTEARAAANLQHPNIVAIHEVGQHEGRHYFSMDYIEGKSLAQVVRENPLPAAKAAGYVKTIAEAIEYAHQHGTLHRDLKPANILIDSFDQPRVTDFGLAKRIEGTAQLTATGSVMGTPSYMPPEQARANDGMVGPASDVYSIGAVLYELLTGRPPFLGESLVLTLNQVLNTEPVAPRLLNPEVPRDLETICLKCLQKEPSKRYGTAAALAEDLGRFLRHEPIVARPVGTLERTWRWCRRNPIVASLGAAISLLLLIGAVGGTTLATLFNREARRAEQNEKRADANAAESAKNAERAIDEAQQAKIAQSASETEKQRANAALSQSEQRLYINQISAAQREWETNNAAAALSYLNSCRRDLRGWEHDFLYTLFTKNQTTFRGHTGFVASVAFSPDGKRIVSGSGDKTVKVWDATSGQEILTLKGHTDAVTSVAFSPDGKRIVSGGVDKIKVWDAISGQETLMLNTGLVTGVAFSPDGKRIVSGSYDEIKVWDATSGQEILMLNCHTHHTSVAFSPDGKRIVGASKVWDATSGQATLTLKGHTGSEAFSPDGKRIVSASVDNTVKVWDATSGQGILTLKGHTHAVTSVAFSPDGKRIVSGSLDKMVKVWNATSGQETFTLKGHIGEVDSVAFSPDGKRIVSGSNDGTIKVWDATSGQDTLTLQGQGFRVAFSPDGKRIISGSNDGTVKVWDATSGQETLTLKGPTDRTVPVLSIAFSPDGKRIVSGGGDRTSTLKVWDAASGQETATLKGHTVPVLSVAFSPDSKRIVTGSAENTLKVWEATSGHETLTLKGHIGEVDSVAFSPDGKRIVSGSSDKTVKVWDATSGQEILTLKGHNGLVCSVAFSPDGKRISSGSEDNTLKVWDATSGQEILTLKGHTEVVKSVAFSPDGKRIVSGSWDTVLKVWEATSGQEILTLKGHTGPVISVAFSPDGKRIVSGSGSEIKVWDASRSDR